MRHSHVSSKLNQTEILHTYTVPSFKLDLWTSHDSFTSYSPPCGASTAAVLLAFCLLLIAIIELPREEGRGSRAALFSEICHTRDQILVTTCHHPQTVTATWPIYLTHQLVSRPDAFVIICMATLSWIHCDPCMNSLWTPLWNWHMQENCKN